jgi:RNA polymerase sigma-70 factor, ECF subfamily
MVEKANELHNTLVVLLTESVDEYLRELIGSEIVYMEEEQQQKVNKEQEFSWIRAFLNNDRSAFDNLVRCHQDRVFNICYRMMGEYEEANDCAQETFLKAYKALKNFRFEARFSTWVLTIALNVCRNRLKSMEYRYQQRMVRIKSTMDNTGPIDSIEIEDPAPDALTQLAKREQQWLVQKAIDGLPRAARAVAVLRDIEGLSYDEIAQITGYNPGTVKSKLARARQQLRDKLKGLI